MQRKLPSHCLLDCEPDNDDNEDDEERDEEERDEKEPLKLIDPPGLVERFDSDMVPGPELLKGKLDCAEGGLTVERPDI